MQLLRTTPDHPGYRELIPQLDAFLSVTDGEEHAFYNQFNGSDDIPYALVALNERGAAVACGALKPFRPTHAEVKRMFTLADHRGRGIAVRVLRELELWARELGYTHCLLETGLRQTAAIRLYEKCGYRRIDNYGQYVGVENSVCMEKKIGLVIGD